jgi:copper chaperone CopZ
MALEKTFIIEGMSCGGCVNSLTRVLESVPGIEPLKVEVGKATLRVDEAVTTDVVRAAVDRAGFELVKEA